MKSLICLLLLFCLIFQGVKGVKNEAFERINSVSFYLSQQGGEGKGGEAEADPNTDCAQVPKKLFSQQLDHFNFLLNTENNVGRWGQRYSVQDEWYGGPGYPVFIFLAGEANMDFFCFQTVSLRQWARQFQALYIVLEHRFYGESLPFGVNANTEHLMYLSSDQAMADAADFIAWYNHSHLSAASGPASPWVVFGCSYSAGLAAWFRLKYPQLVVAAVAPSGPVEAQLNYTGYFGHFGRVAGSPCAEAVQGASDYIYALTQSQSGLQQLSTLFGTCPALSLSKPNNTWFFLNQLMGTVGSSDQFNNPPAYPLNATCQQLLANGTSPEQVAAQWAALMRSSGSLCLGVDEEAYRVAMALPVASASRSWLWQTCSQFSWLKPSYPGTSVFFPNQDLPHLLSYCQSAFGIAGMSPAVHNTNVNYGGSSRLTATNVLFTNGLFDPWHLVSVNANLPSGVQAVTYEAGHCAPMTMPTAIDPPSLSAARQSIVMFLAKILNQTPK